MRILEATEDQTALAQDWHGGQASMLYAIASTGTLTLGPIRPYGTTTDREHAADLLYRLYRELSEIAQSPDASPEDRQTAAEFRQQVSDLHTAYQDED